GIATGERPSVGAAAPSSARIIVTIAKLPGAAFVPGSDQGKTGAKPELFQNLADVKALSERLNGETAKLVSASGDLDAMRKQLGATGAACKACHDKYRDM